MAVAASDLVGELIAQTPQGKVLESKFKGLADIALARGEDGRLHATPTSASRARRTTASTPAAATVTSTISAASAAGRRGGGRGGRGGGGRGGGGSAAWRRRRADGPRPRRGRLRRPRDPQRRLGLRQQPDRHRGRDQAHHRHGDRSRQGERDRQEGRRQARAGAGLPASTGRRRSRRIPATVSQDEKQALVQKVVDLVVKNKDVTSVNASVQLEHEWKYFASSEGSYIEQETCDDDAEVHRHRAQGSARRGRATSPACRGPAAGKSPKPSEMLENAERIAAEAVEICTAKPVEHGGQGSRS